MKKLLWITSLASIVLAITTLIILVLTTPKIAYVESNKLVSNYVGMKAANLEYQQKAAIWQSNLDTLKNELQSFIDKYEDSRNELSKKERMKSEEVIKAKREQFSAYMQSIEQKAQQEDQRMTKEVVSHVDKFLKKYAEDHGYDMILGANETGNIVYSKEIMNITDQVLLALNKSENGK